jgi:hypothetical protein
MSRCWGLSAQVNRASIQAALCVLVTFSSYHHRNTRSIAISDFISLAWARKAFRGSLKHAYRSSERKTLMFLRLAIFDPVGRKSYKRA